MPRINLAGPRRHRLVSNPVLPALLTVLLCVVAPLYIWHDHLVRETRARHHTNAEQRAALETLERRLAPLRITAGEHRDLVAAHKTLGKLEFAGCRRAAVLHDLAVLHGHGTRYTALRFNGERLHLQGAAASADDLDALLARLGTAPWFREPALQNPRNGRATRNGRTARTKPGNDERQFVLSVRHHREAQALVSPESAQ